MSVLQARAGRASLIEIVGMFAGLAAPVLIVGWILVAAARFPESNEQSYSHVTDTISALGDATLPAHGAWYTAVNLMLAVLLLLFTYSVYRRAPVGRMTTVFLFLAVVATFVIALSPCTGPCSLANGVNDVVHLGSAFATALLILLIPWAASQKTADTARYRIVKQGSRFLFQAGVLAALFLLSFIAIETLTATNLPIGLAERALWASGYAWISLVSVVMVFDWRGRVRRHLDVTRLQENVVYGHRRNQHGRVAVAEIADAAAFRRWLQAAVENDIIRSEVRRPRPNTIAPRDYTVTIGFTARGLKRLGINYEPETIGTDAFYHGMQESKLGDRVDDDWEPSWRDPRRHHVVVWITAQSAEALGRAIADTQLDLLNPHVSQKMASGDLAREPFGFIDGISNPWIEDVHPTDDPKRFGGGKLVRGKNGEFGWAPIAVGEFVLGEFDEGGDQSPVPKPSWIFEGASFLVVRKLRQNVGALDAWATEAGQRTGQSPTSIKSKLVGRTPDGDPLAERTSSQNWNEFRYGDDPEGFKCPMAAHVRRANPRDALGFDGVPTHRRRIIRRGMPYHDDDDRRGVMFMALNARIAGQFEFIQRVWLNDGAAFHVGANPDPIGGHWDGSRDVLITAAQTPVLRAADQPFVTSVGGEYFVIPPFSALERMATP